MHPPRRIRPATLSRVLLADDQAIFRAGIARVLAGEGDITVLGQCSSAELALETVAASRSCVLILAETLKVDMDRVLAAAHATATRVILMMETGKKPAAALLRRIDGVLTRQTSAADLLACIRAVSNGERRLHSPENSAEDSFGDRIRALLSTRELQIIGFVVQGRKNRQIAGEIGTTEQVVKNYLRSIYDKTGSSDRLELALFTLHHRTLAEAAASAAQATAQTLG